MGRFINFLKAVRNNWKKSTFAALALSYGVNYAKDSYDTKQLMREYCKFAARYGEVSHPVSQDFRHVTVILNPAANKRKARAQFDKYCAPLFHLAGLAVTIVQTEFAGQTKDLPEIIDPKTSAIVVAGGDGTLSETVTGLLRRAQNNTAALKDLPVGVLPLGRTNSVAQALLGDRQEVKALADATLAVIDGAVVPVDVICVEPLQEEEDSTKPMYSVSRLEWGCYRDAKSKRDKYWYFGGLREYVSCVGNHPRVAEWACSYTNPCIGCSRCVTKKTTSGRRWWSIFLPRKTPPEVDYSKVVNEACGVVHHKTFSAVEFAVASVTVGGGLQDNKEPHMTLTVGPSTLSWFQFVQEGWRRLQGGRPEPMEMIPVRELTLTPPEKEADEWFSIDSEDFEVKPVKISLLPKTLYLFQPRPNLSSA